MIPLRTAQLFEKGLHPCCLREAIEKDEDFLPWDEASETGVVPLGPLEVAKPLEDLPRAEGVEETKASEANTEQPGEGPLRPGQPCPRSWGEERREEMHTGEDPSKERTTRLSSRPEHPVTESSTSGAGS